MRDFGQACVYNTHAVTNFRGMLILKIDKNLITTKFNYKVNVNLL